MKPKFILLLLLVIVFNSCQTAKNVSASEIVISKLEVDNLLNTWHKDVINFNLESYFGLMDNDFIFLGTDPKERWSKDEFYGFCKPYFEKKSTWSFKPLWRNIYFSEDGKTAWFEEQLKTWMEECRGSGVLVLKNNQWKLIHYNLTVLIENEKVKSFIELRRL